MNWLKQRWAEPESRAAAAAAIGSIGAFVGDKIDAKSMAIAVATAGLAFLFPSAGTPK